MITRYEIHYVLEGGFKAKSIYASDKLKSAKEMCYRITAETIIYDTCKFKYIKP